MGKRNTKDRKSTDAGGSMRGELAATEIREFPLGDLNPADYNPHAITDEALAGLTKSIERFGYVEPIIVNVRGGRNRIVGGHSRYKSLLSLGATKAACVVVDLSDRDEKLLNIALNNPHIQGQFTEALGEMIAKLREGIGGEQALLDLRISELAAELPTPEHKGNTGDDDVPDPPKKAITKPGDLWILGEHRLLCGDSTKAEDVERVMGGDKAGLMNTDPPYGIAFDNASLGPTRRAYKLIENDDKVDGEALQAFLVAAFMVAAKYAIKPSAAWYLWHPMLTQGTFFAAAAAAAADVLIHRQIIWVKDRLILGRGQYHWKHELCFMGWVRGNEPSDYGLGNGERTQTTVWEIASVTQAERKEFNHSTPKPVELFTIPIVKHLKTGELCYEPFAGSGPQFIAAEKLGRRCYGLELDPVYCDVIVARWEAWTGKKAKRVKA